MTEEDKKKIIIFSQQTKCSLIDSFISSKINRIDFDWVVTMYYIRKYMVEPTKFNFTTFTLE